MEDWGRRYLGLGTSPPDLVSGGGEGRLEFFDQTLLSAVRLWVAPYMILYDPIRVPSQEVGWMSPGRYPFVVDLRGGRDVDRQH